MSWEHEFDTMLWMGGRNHDDANQPDYEPQKIKDFVFNYTMSNDELPSVEEIMSELDLPDEQYEDVYLELMIYNHEEELDFRESVPGHHQTA